MAQDWRTQHSWPALSTFDIKHKGLAIAKPQGILEEMSLEKIACACFVDRLDGPNEESQTGSVSQRDRQKIILKNRIG